MQRIDENTYIDDTLVTCAEYQLFIDDVWKREKYYYQPDHWLFYEFPEGQARKPIVGVRQSDAEAFCKWLAKREAGEWNYRLPTIGEATTILINPTEKSPFGYWLNDYRQFAWIGKVPKDARELDTQRALKDALMANETSDPILLAARNNALDLARTIPLNLNDYQKSSINRARTSNISPSLKLALEIAIKKSFKYAWRRVREFDYKVPIAYKRKKIGNWLNHLNSALSDCLDLFTLQERIAGRSPAFEGIRLVKERIK